VGRLDRVGAESRPFRCVGSARMYGADGPVRDDPWEGRHLVLIGH
jgi:hypothetical protein